MNREKKLEIKKKKKKEPKKPDKKKEEKKKKEGEKDDKQVEGEEGFENFDQKALLLLKNYKLTLEEKEKIMSLVRLPFVSHHTLIKAVKEDIISPFKDMILEAVSAKLSTYEKADTNYSIILQPRECYSESKGKKILNKYKDQPKLEDFEERRGHEYKRDNLSPKEDFKGVKEYETIKSNFLDNSYKKEKKRKIEFIYSYNLDENGAFYWLGSKGRNKNYKNPYTIGLIKVFFSSISDSSRYDFFVGRTLENCRTSNQQESYMGVDFGKMRTLFPKQYSIRNRDSLKHVLLNWVLEASLDYQNWYELDRRIHLSSNEETNNFRKKERGMLLQKGVITTWAVDIHKLKSTISTLSNDIKSFKGFRYFRVKQIGKNSSDSYNLALSGFELYGTGFGDWFFN